MDISLEKALAQTESDADTAFKAAVAVVSAIKKFRGAAHNGDLRELRKTIDATEQAMAVLRQQLTLAKEGWRFDEEAYLSGKDFLSELLLTAQQMGVKIFEQDDRLYCYPFLIRILPNERAILIDKKRERGIRPSILISHLMTLQGKPVRFKPEAFLESLYHAYSIAVSTRPKEHANSHVVVPLHEIYDLLTLLPGQSKEYSRQEFSRDIYLLDQSRVTQTKKGSIVSFPASTATKSASGTITVITQAGHEKKYYGISFANE